MLNLELNNLYKELKDDPLNCGYSTMTTIEIVDDLMEKRYMSLNLTMFNKRTLYSVIGLARGVEFLRNFKNLISYATDELTKEQYQEILDMLNDVTSGGIDISLEESRNMINQFITIGFFTLEEGNKIKSLAETYQSRASQIGYSEITAPMVERCREVM